MHGFERLPVSIQTVYADLAQRAWTGNFQEVMAAGGSAHRHAVDGRDYWYWHPPTQNGKRPPARYLGPDTPEMRDRIRNRRQLAGARRDRLVMVRSLRAGMVPGPDGLSGRVLAALAEAGAFRLRAVVVGSLAFQCYTPMLGFVPDAGSARTGDVDIGQFASVSLAVNDRMDEDILSVLKGVDPDFEAVPSPFDPKRTLRYALRGGEEERFAVDVLVPLRGPPRDTPMPLPALGGDGQPLRFLDFLIRDEMDALVLHGPGIPVKVPAPERFAVHKLLVADRRRRDPPGLAKARKDLSQATQLVRVLGSDRPDELAMAWEEMLGRGPSWRISALRSRGMLEDDVRDLLPVPEGPGKRDPSGPPKDVREAGASKDGDDGTDHGL